MFLLHDMIEQPNFNWATQNNRGEWSLRDVSKGDVRQGVDGKPECIEHGAMNAVVADRSIWRCLACGRATYVTRAVTTDDTGRYFCCGTDALSGEPFHAWNCPEKVGA